MPEYEWERRRPGELTAYYLGRVLEWAGGLDDMPTRARQAHFDDYFAPPEVASGMEILALVAELEHRKGRLKRVSRLRVNEIIKAVKEGEFDGTAEESARWAASKDGQEAFRMLLRGE